MKKVLLAGFEGINNSARIITEKCDYPNKLFLKNDFDICAEQMLKAVDMYKNVLIIGQKPAVKRIYIESAAHYAGHTAYMRYDCNIISKIVESHGIKTKLSVNAGDYLCNRAYYTGLQKAGENNGGVLLLHIPYMKNIANADKIASAVCDIIHYMKESQ